MLGGPEGTAAKDGKLAISESIPLADLKSSLAEYLKKYEDGENYDFPAKPLDLRKLHIVAFVQNDESHEVLQTNTVSVAASNSTASNAITPATRSTPASCSLSLLMCHIGRWRWKIPWISISSARSGKTGWITQIPIFSAAERLEPQGQLGLLVNGYILYGWFRAWLRSQGVDPDSFAPIR